MQLTEIVREAIHRTGCECVAVVVERPGVWDFAVRKQSKASIIIRCADRAEPTDYRQLEEMLIQGDFDRAALIYAVEAHRPPSNDIESYPLSRIHEFTASLARESVG